MNTIHLSETFILYPVRDSLLPPSLEFDSKLDFPFPQSLKVILTSTSERMLSDQSKSKTYEQPHFIHPQSQ